MLVLLEDGDCPVAVNARPWDRLRARLHATKLDTDLAAGASPDGSMELALRARTLVQTCTRRDLAVGARRILAQAAQQPSPSRLPVPVCRDQVRACSAELTELIGRLLAAGPVSARGVAQTRMLLASANSPVYDRASSADLRARVSRAADALLTA
jgi:hypothetical protein